MLTLPTSESISLTFLTFSPRLLRMWGRAAWLGFHRSWPVRRLLLLLLLQLLSWPRGTPSGIAMAGRSPISCLGHSSAQERLMRCGSTGQGKWVTHIADIASESFCPADHSQSLTRPGLWRKIPGSMRLEIKSQPLAKLWLPHCFKGTEVSTAEDRLGLLDVFVVAVSEQVQLDHENFPREGTFLPITVVLMGEEIRPPSESIFCGIDLCQILQWALRYGLLGCWEQDWNLPFVSERAWQYFSEIPLNWQQSTQELALHNIHKEWLLLKNIAKWFTLFQFKPPFLFSP